MPRNFILRSRKAKSSAAPSPSTPDRSNRSKHKPSGTGSEDLRGGDKYNAKKKNASPRGVADDDDALVDDDYSSRSEESLSSESSYDHATYLGGGPDDIVDMIRNVFSGSNDNDSQNGSNNDESSSYETKANKLCYRLAINDGTLTEMDLECASIGRDAAKDIAELLPTNTRLQRLSLTCCNDKQPRQNFRTLLYGLPQNSSITEIELREVDLDREAASWLGAALAQNRSAQKICLKDCNFIASGLAVLFMGMQHNKQLQELAIVSCELAGANTDIVSASLPLMKLRSLSLVNTNLTLDGLRFLCDNIVKTPSLAHLNLSRSELGRQGTELLAETLKSPKQPQITTLVLSSCSLDDQCINELSKGLRRSSTITTIDLSKNDFGDQAALYLKGLLEKNSAIKELRLEGCGISRKRKKAIEDGLRYNNSILKSFGFSATTSLAILQTGDVIEEMGGQIMSSVTEVGAAVVSP